MQIFRNINNFKSIAKNYIATIGNYDGIHLGHKEILKKVCALSKETGLPNILITFEPHPREYFLNHAAPHYRLMTWRDKIKMLENYGIETVLILRFDAALANLSPIDFIQKFLVKTIHIKYLVIGENFRFGANNNTGDVKLLQKYGEQSQQTESSFQVIPIPIYKIDGHQVSSSLIRQMLKNDDLTAAQKLLGRPHSVVGRIVHGDKRGRALGFPTANIHFTHNIVPLAGVYAVKVYNLTPQPLFGVANIGFRPSITSANATANKRLLEIYLFDFNQDIYGKIIKVEFIYKLRNEKKFANFTLLKQQIQKDFEMAKSYFNNNSIITKHNE